MARSCINDANYDSYTEVTLQCNVEGRNESYKLVQDAKVAPAGSDLAAQLGIKPGKAVFVAVFSPSKGITNEPQPRSAVCVYSLEEIQTKFDENIHMCFNGSIKYRNMGYISGPIQNGECPQVGVQPRRGSLSLPALKHSINRARPRRRRVAHGKFKDVCRRVNYSIRTYIYIYAICMTAVSRNCFA